MKYAINLVLLLFIILTSVIHCQEIRSGTSIARPYTLEEQFIPTGVYSLESFSQSITDIKIKINPETYLATNPEIATDSELYRQWKTDYDASMGRRWLARSTTSMNWITENGYVRADVDKISGEFDEGCDPNGTGFYTKLTFSWPESPGTEWVMYNVDGNWAKTNEELPSVSSSYMSGDTIFCIWNNWNGVYIRQEIVPVRLGRVAGECEQIKFKAVLKSADGAEHDVGCIIFYDTMLRDNDDARISTIFGYTNIAEIFFAPNIPSIWHAYENSYPPAPTDIVATGILTGYEAAQNPPDVFWYGSWPLSVYNGWDNSEWILDTGYGFDDSAVMIKWHLHHIIPGDSVIFVTYYGIGEVEGNIYFSHNPPTFECNDADIEPNPFPINVIITNGLSETADSICLTLNLSASSLIYTGGDPNPKCFTTIAGYGGSEIVSWSVTIPPSTYGTTQYYTIEMTVGSHPDYDSSATYYVNIPACCSLEVTASADDSILHAGDSTFLHADIVWENPPVNFEWWSNPAGFSSDQQNPNTGPIVEDTWFIVRAIDSRGCEDLDSILITIFKSKCDAHPDPFTPNGDEINSMAIFDYPGKGIDDANIKILIFDLKNRLVRTLEGGVYMWDGKDESGNDMPKGVYLYIIKNGSNIICHGTIHLAR